MPGDPDDPVARVEGRLQVRPKSQSPLSGRIRINLPDSDDVVRQLHLDDIATCRTQLSHIEFDQLTRHRGSHPLGVEPPPGEQPVGRVAAVDAVVHLPVEIRLESVDIHTELDEVEPGVAADERVEGPHDRVEALLQSPGPLVHLQGAADVLIAVGIEHRGHVRVQVLMPVITGSMATSEAEGRPDGPAIAIGGAAVPTGMHDGPHQVGGELRGSVGRRPHLVEHPLGLGQFTRLDQQPDLDIRATLRAGQVIVCAVVAHSATVATEGVIVSETSLLDSARDLLPAMTDAVEALVTVESPSSDLAACTSVAQEAVGIFEGWVPEPARIEEHGGRPAWRWGPDQPRILLLGHLDTVWPLGTLARLPFTVNGDRITGPGCFDMKAGVVQGWAALTLLGLSEADGVGMLLTTDEEVGSHASRGIIAHACAHAEAVLVLEPSIEAALKTSRKGTSWYSVEFTGRAAHAGLDPEKGINALLSAADLARAARAWGDAAAGTTVTPTLLSAGTTANTVPATASLTVDVRAWTAAEQERVDHAFRTWADEHGATWEIHGGIDRPALEPASSARLFAQAQEAARSLGLPALDGRSVGGASDGNLTAAAGHDTLDGLGAIGDGAHADHEWISVSGMAERAALLAALIRAS